MAFWKFGKSDNKNEARGGDSKEDPKKVAIDIAAFIIDLQLKRAGDLPGFEDTFHSNFTRGYFVGCFTAAMQAFKIEGYGENSKTLAFIVGGHIALIGENHGFNFAMDSVTLNGNKIYELGNRLGGQELIDFLNKEVVVPTQLFNYFKGN